MDEKKVEKVLIATWGNPFGWWETEYLINRTKVKSRSTLPALIDAYKPERVIIITLDTITNYIGCGEGSKNDCKEIWPYPESDGKFKNLTGCNNIIQDVERRVRWYLKKLSEVTKPESIGSLLSKYLDEGKIDVVVAPGIGDFSANLKKSGVGSKISVRVTVENGKATDYYHFLMAELAQRLSVGDVEIVLDLTHGLNFMPALTYRAVRELSTIGAYFGNIKLTVVNSEPHPKAEGPLNIHVIEETDVAPSPMYFKVDEPYWDAFLSSLANGFPLAFATFYPGETHVLKEIRKIIEDYQKKTKVRTENQHVIIERPPMDERLSKLSLLYYTVKRGRESRELKGLAERLPKGELTLDELATVTKIFEKIPAIGTRAKNDLDKFFENSSKWPADWLLIGPRNGKNKNWTPYTRICGPNEDQQRDKCINPRNFLAHSGFDYNVFEVKEHNSNYYVRYSPEKENLVLELCLKVSGGDTDV